VDPVPGPLSITEYIILRHYATSQNVAGSISMVLGSTQPLTEMSTRNLHGDKGRPMHKADNLAAICEPIV
jgi:hypothetical protein